MYVCVMPALSKLIIYFFFVVSAIEYGLEKLMILLGKQLKDVDFLGTSTEHPVSIDLINTTT